MTTHQHGQASLTWNEAEFRSELEVAASEVIRVGTERIAHEAQGIYTKAKQHWPVRSGASMRSLGWRMTHDAGVIKGEVRAAAAYARYVVSSQVSVPAFPATAEEYLTTLHKSARGPQDHRRIMREEQALRKAYAHARANLPALAQYVTGAGGGKTTGKAARNGSAMWLLLRWPEAAAGERLTEALGPVIERAMRALEG